MQTIVVLPWGHGQKSHTAIEIGIEFCGPITCFSSCGALKKVSLRNDSGVRQKLIIASVLHKTIRYNITFPQDRRG